MDKNVTKIVEKLTAYMRLRKFKKSDTRQVAWLVSRTYATFNKTEGTKSAVQRYVDLYNPTKNFAGIKKQFSKSPIFIVAEEKGKIFGVIRGRPEKVTNLFVLGSKHRGGIGTQLMKAFEKEAKKIGARYIKSRASLYAVPFYKKMGFKKTTGVRKFKGLKIQPLVKNLN